MTNDARHTDLHGLFGSRSGDSCFAAASERKECATIFAGSLLSGRRRSVLGFWKELSGHPARLFQYKTRSRLIRRGRGRAHAHIACTRARTSAPARTYTLLVSDGSKRERERKREREGERERERRQRITGHTAVRDIQTDR